MENNILLCDIGGTHARFALAVTKGEYSNFKKYRLNDFQSFDDIIALYISECSQTISNAQFACARAPVNGVLQYKRYAGDPDYPIDFNHIKTKFNWPNLTVLNDLTAATYGLPLLKPSDTETIIGNSVAPWNAGQILISIGTGAGHSGICNGQVLETPGGHYYPAFVTDEHIEVRNFIRHRKDKNFSLVIEDFVSGQGLRNITEFISKTPNEDMNPDEFMQELKNHPNAIRLFFEFLGIHTNIITAATGYYGGVYLAGGVIDNLIKNNLTNWAAFESYFKPNMVQSMSHRLNGVKVAYVKDIELPLLGLTTL